MGARYGSRRFVGQLGKLRPIGNRPTAAFEWDSGGSQPPRRLPACPTSRQRLHLSVAHPVLTMRILAAAAALFLTGCGYVGDPQPPLANIPPRVSDLAALQRDLRAGTANQCEPNQWAASARQIPPGAMANGIARYEIPAADWIGEEVIFGVRAVAGNGKQSGWSNFVVVPVVTPPEKPVGIAPAVTLQGVRLTWQGRGADFRVFRKTGDGDYAPVANVQKPEWTDTATEFGKR